MIPCKIRYNRLSFKTLHSALYCYVPGGQQPCLMTGITQAQEYSRHFHAKYIIPVENGAFNPTLLWNAVPVSLLWLMKQQIRTNQGARHGYRSLMSVAVSMRISLLSY